MQNYKHFFSYNWHVFVVYLEQLEHGKLGVEVPSLCPVSLTAGSKSVTIYSSVLVLYMLFGAHHAPAPCNALRAPFNGTGLFM